MWLLSALPTHTYPRNAIHANQVFSGAKPIQTVETVPGSDRNEMVVDLE
jgi:hypothetical protein